MNKIVRVLGLALVLICYVGSMSVARANDTYKSFVDETVYRTLPFEEDPADEFLAEKSEFNRLYRENEFNSDLHEILLSKLKELKAKEAAKYGEKYFGMDVIFVFGRLSAWDWEWKFMENFNQRLAVHEGNDLKALLQNENTWRDFHAELDEMTRGFDVPPELNFRLDRNLIKCCVEILGETNPVTLKHKINLIQDYSVLGDSKFALEMATDLLPEIEAAFGASSREVAAVLNLMAEDYKTLGNYRASEETLLKVIDVNRQLYGEESSPELVASLVALAKLKGTVPNSDTALYDALDLAAKNLPKDDLYRLGYYRVKILNGYFRNGERQENLNRTYTQERNFMETRHGYEFIKCVDLQFEQAESYREQGMNHSSLTWDLLAITECKSVLGNVHHKTLKTLCDLSGDYLALNQPDYAEELARESLNTSRNIYGEEHPCTIYAIHSLTNVYRHLGLYSVALMEDLNAYELCAKNFTKSSIGEPLENLTALMDIADDYRGMKNYSEAIRYYVKYLVQAETFNSASIPQTAQALKNLTYLYNLSGEYEKTIKLYEFLRTENNSYSLNNLPVEGLIAAHTADVLGEALSAVGNEEDAAHVYSQELEMLESVRFFNSITTSTSENRQKWFAQAVPYYKKMASFFTLQNEAEKSFRVAELCKGRTLAEQYNELLAIYKGGLNDDEILKLNEYHEKISFYQKGVDEDFYRGSASLKFSLRMAHLRMMDEYRSYRNQLSEKYPGYKEILERGKTYGIVSSFLKVERFFAPEHLKTLIPRDHCYISYFVVNEDEASNTRTAEILVFVVDDNGNVKSFRIAADEEFFAVCNLYRALLQYPNLNSLNRAGKYLRKKSEGRYILTETSEPLEGTSSVKTAEGFRNAKQELSVQLGEKLLAPLAEHISTKTTWIISPDGELNTIPFETLQFNGKIAIESADICYVPSLAVLKLMKETGEKNNQLSSRRDLFAMGNAVYDEFGEAEKRGNDEIFAAIQRSPDGYVDLTQLKWKNLEGTGKELEKVSAFFSANTQKMITGSEASERNLKQLDKNGELAQYKLILLAAHGLFIPERPDLNAIVLSQIADAENDGYVTVGEWMGYKLNSDLVYLSACESGRGDYRAGEGIIGLPYALTIAGNKDTVMSLWEVDDTATVEFTSAVFEKLSRGMTEVRALNETKREFLRNPNANLNSSSVWAAFLLYGF